MKASVFALTIAAGCALAQNARAQEYRVGDAERPGYFGHSIAAPTRSFELSLGTGYTQGFGSLQSGVGLPSVAGKGLTLDLGAAYRIDPRWSVGLTGEYQELTPQRSDAARGFTAGVAGAYHFAPYTTTDPWVQLGASYRSLWETRFGANPLQTQGLELGRLTTGVDFHLIDGAVIAPTIGAALDTFLWQNNGGAVAIQDPRLSTFVFAGIQGRIDFGPMRAEASSTTTTSATE